MQDQDFIKRKADHIRVALLPESQALNPALDGVTLQHDSLPDLNLDQLELSTQAFGLHVRTPFFIAGMTAGHSDAQLINERLAKLASSRGWIFGLGSQRRELDIDYQDSSVQNLKKQFPGLILISNLGIAQLIEVHQNEHWSQLSRILDLSRADALAIHLNPLQEAVQMEGTPQFRGGFRALVELCKQVKIPILLKETGSGMSELFLTRIRGLPIHGVDVSGLGGTHWGRVEGLRAHPESRSAVLGETFKNWGVTTVDSILNADRIFKGYEKEIWASGGIRNGLDAAKCIALGASRVGFARPALEAALKSDAELERWMETVEAEFRIAMFCTNSRNVTELRDQRKWIRK